MHAEPVEASSRSLPRRIHRRVPLEVPVSLSNGEPRLLDVARDISEGGLGLRTDHPLAPGTFVVVTMQLQRRTTFLQAAEVVWSGPEAMGLRFVALSPMLSDTIDTLRRELARC